MVLTPLSTIISVLLVEETRAPGENQRPVASHWQTERKARSVVSYRRWKFSFMWLRNAYQSTLYGQQPHCQIVNKQNMVRSISMHTLMDNFTLITQMFSFVWTSSRKYRQQLISKSFDKVLYQRWTCMKEWRGKNYHIKSVKWQGFIEF